MGIVVVINQMTFKGRYGKHVVGHPFKQYAQLVCTVLVKASLNWQDKLIVRFCTHWSKIELKWFILQSKHAVGIRCVVASISLMARFHLMLAPS